MRSTLMVTPVLLLLAALSGCTKDAPEGDVTGTIEVTLTLDPREKDGKTICKATAPEEITLDKDRRRILWTVTDNCSEPGVESETQFAFKYQGVTKKKWLDAEKAVARTEKGKTGQIQYRGHARGQAAGAEAYYTVLFNGEIIADPKVVWGP
jgi:hypothetical protein